MTTPALPSPAPSRAEVLRAVETGARLLPNQRFAQLISNFAGWLPGEDGTGTATAAMTDAELVTVIREFDRKRGGVPVGSNPPPESEPAAAPESRDSPEVRALLADLRRQIRAQYGCEPEDLPPRPAAPPRTELLAAIAAAWGRQPALRFGELVAELTDAADADCWGPGGLYDLEDADLLRAARRFADEPAAVRAAA